MDVVAHIIGSCASPVGVGTCNCFIRDQRRQKLKSKRTREGNFSYLVLTLEFKE